MERQGNFNLGYAMWEDVGKPLCDALLVGGFLGGLAYTVSKQPETGIVWGFVGGTTAIVKKVFIDGFSVNKYYVPEENNQLEDVVDVPELKPWEIDSQQFITKTNVIRGDAYPSGNFYDLPIQEEKFQRASFHILFLGGRFSHNYLTDPKHGPKIMTKKNLTTLEHYLVDTKAARWKSIYDKRGGVELLPDAIDMIKFYGKKYNPSPTERLLLAARCRKGIRTQNTYTYTDDLVEDFEDETDQNEGED